jgi:FMN phosphatase YigB (HAD superfamily)
MHDKPVNGKPPQPLALLFDLGGVVIDIDFHRAFSIWQAGSGLSLEEVAKAFRFDLQYQRHERGEIAASEYYDHLALMLQMKNDHAHIERGWNSIFVREISETTAMIRAARSRIPCYAFTNTNAAHAIAWSSMFPAVAQSFDRIFASHEMGLRKPERAAFDHIAQELGLAAESIVFFDDLPENVQGASEAGLQAVHVRSPADVRNTLRSLGYAPDRHR